MLCGRDRTADQPVTPPYDLPGFDLSFLGAGKFGLDVGCKTQLCPPLKKTLLYNYICSSNTYVRRLKMREPKLGKLELQIMETLWTRGQASIREIQEAFPERARPAYTTIQTTVYRLEGKKAVRRVRKLGNFHIFEAAVSRSAAQRKLIDDLLTLFGGRTQPVMAHLIESGKLTLEDVKEAEKTLRRLEGKDKSA